MSNPIAPQTETPNYVPGDRIRLKPDEAFRYVQPLRGYAEKGREATVVGVLRHEPSSIVVDFDFKGRGKPKSLYMNRYTLLLSDIEPLPKPKPAEDVEDEVCAAPAP